MTDDFSPEQWDFVLQEFDEGFQMEFGLPKLRFVHMVDDGMVEIGNPDGVAPYRITAAELATDGPFAWAERLRLSGTPAVWFTSMVQDDLEDFMVHLREYYPAMWAEWVKRSGGRWRQQKRAAIEGS